MNAFVLAGDRGASHQILGMNKALLPLEGYPLFLHVLRALDRVAAINQIYLIGPQKKMMAEIERALPYVLFTKKIEVMEQKESLIENILAVYMRSLPGYEEGVDPQKLNHGNPPGLFLPADIPLITPAEIESFLLRSDMNRYDYCLGFTPEAALTPFYPTADQPGIEMAYLYLRDKIYRMNNLHLVKPFRIGAGRAVQQMYDHRYQRYLGNRLRLSLQILRTPTWLRGFGYYLLAQGATLFAQAGWNRWASFFRRPLSVEAVEKEVSRFLKTRFKAVETELGGAALDIDDELTYRTISARFREWRDYLARFDRPGTRDSSCSLKTEACG
ncbi:MAG: NTP transferase domain-containing protein [Nitrospirae bacterium]|nr:NTP transferase domain-containing protein [Candidatus Manganitrophaceae bacterium]